MEKALKFILGWREKYGLFRLIAPLVPDKLWLKLMFRIRGGYWMDFNNPKTISEKLFWLKLNYRDPQLTMLVDKYRAKEYLKNKVGEQYVLPALGVWEKADDIDFDKLPNQFVLKCNHASAYGMVICTDKSKLDIKKARKTLQNCLDSNYYLYGREWPYKNVKKCIFCEPYLENKDKSPLVDYKFYCYGGKPEYFMYSVGEATHTVRNHKFDMNCKSIDYLFKVKPTITEEEIHLPDNINEMIEIARKLAVGYQHIRVDMYNIDGKIYMGELTFFSGGGFINIVNEEYMLSLANKIDLSQIKKKY